MQVSFFEWLSKFLRADPERGYVQAEFATQGTLHVPGNRGYEQAFADSPKHSAQMLPSMSSVIPTTSPKRLVIGFGEAAEAPILEQIQSVIHSDPQVSGAVFKQ